MDPLSIAGFSFQLVGAVGQLSKLIHDFYQGGKDLPQRILRFQSQLQLFQANVRSVERFFGNNDFYVAAIEFEHVYRSGTTLELLETLKTCNTGISQFSQEIEKHAPKDGEGIFRRGLTAFKLEESDIDELGTQLEAENASLRESVEKLKAQYKTHEKSITKNSTTQHHKLLNDMQHAKAVSLKVRDVVMKEIARRKALQHATQATPAPSSTGMCPFPIAIADNVLTAKEAGNQDSSRSLNADEFEIAISHIVQQRQASTDEPFADDEIEEVSNLLRRVGKERWAQAPRTYLVLRIIGQIGAMSDFLLEGRKDAHFPYTDRSLPECLDKKARRTFMQKQNLVFSKQHVDIVKGGPHLHLGQSADDLFIVLERLGKGGYGTVDHVQSRFTREDYARKKFSRQHTFRTPKTTMQQYENEINALKKYSHEHLVRFVGSYTDPKYMGVLMEPVADMNLTQFLDKPTFTVQDQDFLLRSLGCLCSAVLYLHENKCRHKDIKPDNILVHEGSMLLTDFGIAMDWADSGRETTIGTARAYSHGYAAPEVHLAKPRKRYTDAVVLGESSKTRESFLEKHGTRSIRPGVNVAGLLEWLAHLLDLRSKHEEVLGWIASMITEDPRLRPEASKLMKQIKAASKGQQSYCGDCCFDDNEQSDFDQSESDVEIVEHKRISRSEESAPVEEDTIRVLEGRTRRPYGLSSVEDAALRNEVLPESSAAPVERSNGTGGNLGRHASVSAEAPNASTATTNLPPILTCPLPDARAPLEGNSPVKPHTGHTSARKQSSRARKKAAKAPTKARQGSVLLPIAEPTNADGAQSPEKTKPDATLPPWPAVPKIPDNLRPIWVQSRADVEDEKTAREELRQKMSEKLSEVQGAFDADSLDLPTHIEDLKGLSPLSWTRVLLEQISPFAQSNMFNTLLHAAIEGVSLGLDRDLVHALVQSGANASTPNLFGNSPLHVAAAMCNPLFVKYLLRFGADRRAGNITGLTPLHLAARERDPASVRILLRDEIEVVNMTENDGWTALHYACRYASWNEYDHQKLDPDSFYTIDLLLQNGADTNAREVRGRTPIALCHENLREEIEVLFQLEHDIRSPDNGDQAPPPSYDSVINSEEETDFPDPCDCEICQIAALLDEVTTLDGEPIIRCHCSACLDELADELYLLMGWNNECECRYCEQTRLLQCVRDGTDGTCQCAKCRHKFYDAKIEDAWNSLQNVDQVKAKEVLQRAGYNAAYMSRYSSDVNEAWVWTMDNIDSVECPENVAALLISLGADISKLGHEKATMLHLAASRGWLTLASVLINSGADVNAQKNSMFTGKRMLSPLVGAVWNGHADMVRLLLRAGALLDARNSTGMTALHYAVLSQNEGVTSTLLAHGPMVDITDDNEYSPLQLAVRDGNILAARALIEAGADLELQTKTAPTALLYAIERRQAYMVEVLLKYGANVHASIGNAPCALIRAAQVGDGQIICLLLSVPEVQQHVNTTEAGTGRTALHLIADKPHDDIIIAEDALVSAGANVNATDSDWSTPLHAAAKAGSAYYTSRLMYVGTDIGWRNESGKTALNVAVKKGHREVVEVLGGRLEKKKKWYQLG
ncbi:hypothetical protein PRZ48_011635 [Zasmidium cellare]|uniref:Protein kinase domain-containing protein n=1 Tax=Zasmidium cellare TaxID=395010 RepID=A0ABR0E7F7_ZASCE|nr:hypothetical protein PRZ48_011635 [Zasmidium cellare]